MTERITQEKATKEPDFHEQTTVRMPDIRGSRIVHNPNMPPSILTSREKPARNAERATKPLKYTVRKLGAAGLVAGGALLGIGANNLVSWFNDMKDGIEYKGTTEYIVQPGDTLSTIIEEQVENYNSVNWLEIAGQITKDPANTDVMFDDNGTIIVPGDVIVIPVRVEQ